MADSESFRTWNMGIGMIAMIDADNQAAAAAAGCNVIGRLVEVEAASERVELVGDWR